MKMDELGHHDRWRSDTGVFGGLFNLYSDDEEGSESSKRPERKENGGGRS